MPRLRTVESASIDAVGYDDANEELYLRFRESGDTYAYYGVEPEVYEELMQAGSMGRFVNLKIKGHYFYRKLDED